MNSLLEDYGLTTNPREAIFLFPDGVMIDGEFDCGCRGLDHNCLKSSMGKSWKEIHDETGVIRLVPETDEALVSGFQAVSKIQRQILNKSGYDIEVYC